jgi:mannose-1-phosphate guanylyltransferase
MWFLAWLTIASHGDSPKRNLPGAGFPAKEETSHTHMPKAAIHKRYALILAGGSGQRFWPISRDALPKQLLKLFGDKTLLELTIERLEGFVPKENILILTNKQQEASVRAIMKDIPAENIVAEPEKRDTAPAIALAVGWVVARDPMATMIVLPADHLIQDHAELPARAAKRRARR